MTTSRGKWITIEGINGSGKSAVVMELLKNYAHLDTFKFTREPGGTDFGAHLRRVLVEKDVNVMTPIDGITKELLFMADRRHHIRVNAPLLDMGINVISDRSDLSSLAYGKAQDSAHIKDLFEWGENFHGGNPDLYIYLSLRPDVAFRRFMERVAKSGDKNMDVKNTREEFDLLYESYVTAADMLIRHGRLIEVVNAEVPLDQVVKNVIEIIDAEVKDG